MALWLLIAALAAASVVWAGELRVAGLQGVAVAGMLLTETAFRVAGLHAVSEAAVWGVATAGLVADQPVVLHVGWTVCRGGTLRKVRLRHAFGVGVLRAVSLVLILPLLLHQPLLLHFFLEAVLAHAVDWTLLLP